MFINNFVVTIFVGYLSSVTVTVVQYIAEIITYIELTVFFNFTLQAMSHD